jgi:hypothetical protein
MNTDTPHDLDAARFLLNKLERAGASRQTMARVRQMVDQAEQEIRIKAQIPNVEPPEGSIVEFRRRFMLGRTIYSYVGTRRGGRWYFTGRMFKDEWLMWHELVEQVTGIGALFEGFNIVRLGSLGADAPLPPPENSRTIRSEDGDDFETDVAWRRGDLG